MNCYLEMYLSLNISIVLFINQHYHLSGLFVPFFYIIMMDIQMSFLHISIERALTFVSDIGLNPILGTTLRFNQVCYFCVSNCLQYANGLFVTKNKCNGY